MLEARFATGLEVQALCHEKFTMFWFVSYVTSCAFKVETLFDALHNAKNALDEEFTTPPGKQAANDKVAELKLT